MSSLPRWVNKTIYNQTPLSVLQINLAALYAQLGYQNSLAKFGDSRGIPLSPPAWVRAETWDAFSGLMPTDKEMADLMGDIFDRSRAEEAAERKRRLALANCGCHSEADWPHWNVVHGVRSKACTRCGHVKDVGWKPEVIRNDGYGTGIHQPERPSQERETGSADAAVSRDQIDPDEGSQTGEGDPPEF